MSVDDLSRFESDLLMVVHNVECRAARNNFLPKWRNDVKAINTTRDLLVNAHKSTNTYIIKKKHVINN